MYLLKVKNRNTGTRCELCSKLTIKTPKQRLGVVLSLLLTLNIFHTLFYSFSIVSFEHVNASWVFIFSIKLYTHTLRKNKLNKEQFILFCLLQIAKDPPPRFKVKFESDVLSSSSTNSKSTDEPCPTPKTEKSIPTSQKPPSPIKSPGTFSSEILYTSEQVPPLPVKPSYSKAAPKHRDTLVLPDIKPSPIKPRTTRNSMQDTFLMNAIEESIGHTNPTPTPTPVQQGNVNGMYILKLSEEMKELFSQFQAGFC